MTITLADVQAARCTLAGAVLRTPMLPAPKLSAVTGAEVFVKYENMQVTNSFKDRGAYVKLAALSGRSAAAASSPCRPATMPRRWPTIPGVSAFPPPS
jgi:threonine dehydratase